MLESKKTLCVKQAAFLLVSFAVAMLLFSCSYHYDNKYNIHSTQPIGGILFFSPVQQEATYLVNGWQYFEGKLLTPDDLKDQTLLPDRYLSIGQYSGMEAGNPSNAPHGSASYRLILALPETPASYTLELPEIYSAYRLYVNDKLMAAYGNPDWDAYRAELHSSSLTFEASGNTQILIAATDFSYLYSGMVYPPAFGTPKAVAALLDAKFAWSLAVTVFALLLGIFQAAVSALVKNRRTLFISLCCLSFAGTICAPVIHRLFSTGIVPIYNIEIFCRYAIYGYGVLLVNDLCNRKTQPEKIASFVATFFPFFATFVSLCAPHLSYQSLLLFSYLAGAYKIICASWMLFTAFFSGLKNKMQLDSLLLLVGVCIFSSSLVADRLYPNFEPIRFGWFSETAGLLFVVLLTVLLLRDSAALYRRQLTFKQQQQQLEVQIQMQKKHYSHLAERMDGIRIAHHDIRHHLLKLSLLLQDNHTTEAVNYLNDLTKGSLSTAPLSFCEIYGIDVLLRYYYSRAEELNVPMTLQAKVSPYLNISEEDLCVVLGNLLENALEAAIKVSAKDRFLSFSMIERGGSLLMKQSNPFVGTLVPDGENFFSSKEEGRHGIGLSSIRATAEKYSGSVWIETEQQATPPLFTIKILMIANGTKPAIKKQ